MALCCTCLVRLGPSDRTSSALSSQDVNHEAYVALAPKANRSGIITSLLGSWWLVQGKLTLIHIHNWWRKGRGLCCRKEPSLWYLGERKHQQPYPLPVERSTMAEKHPSVHKIVLSQAQTQRRFPLPQAHAFNSDNVCLA